MEEKKIVKVLDGNEEKDVNGGAANYCGGYCPFTWDRNCRVEMVKTFNNDDEICRECGYRAW